MCITDLTLIQSLNVTISHFYYKHWSILERKDSASLVTVGTMIYAAVQMFEQ